MAISGVRRTVAWGVLTSMLLGPATARASSIVEAPSAGSQTLPSVSAVSPVAVTPEVSEQVLRVVGWVIEHADNHALAFMVVDKRRARLFAYSPSGALIGETAVLLGQSIGDESTGNLGLRQPASLSPAERTTPAGRFATEPGHNRSGQDIVWFDYDASLAIHRLRPAALSQHREERLGSARSDDKRISFGCIVVPVAFYDAVVQPSLGRQRGVLYVLPETRPLQAYFADDRLSLGVAARP